MKCNAIKKINKKLWRVICRKLGLLVFDEGVINERFVAACTVMWSRICGCSRPRCDFSVTRGQQMMNAIRWIKQFAGKKSRQSLSRLSQRDRSSAYCNDTQYSIEIFNTQSSWTIPDYWPGSNVVSAMADMTVDPSSLCNIIQCRISAAHASIPPVYHTVQLR